MINRQILKLMIELHERELSKYKDMTTTCQSCEHSSLSSKKCLKFGEVPSDFWDRGCEQWEHFEVPF